MVAFQQYGNGSADAAANGNLTWGLVSLYLMSRRGAEHLLDFSTCRNCYFRTFSWYMLGVSFATCLNVQRIANKTQSGQNLTLHRRVH